VAYSERRDMSPAKPRATTFYTKQRRAEYKLTPLFSGYKPTSISQEKYVTPEEEATQPSPEEEFEEARQYYGAQIEAEKEKAKLEFEQKLEEERQRAWREWEEKTTMEKESFKQQTLQELMAQIELEQERTMAQTPYNLRWLVAEEQQQAKAKALEEFKLKVEMELAEWEKSERQNFEKRLIEWEQTQRETFELNIKGWEEQTWRQTEIQLSTSFEEALTSIPKEAKIEAFDWTPEGWKISYAVTTPKPKEEIIAEVRQKLGYQPGETVELYPGGSLAWGARVMEVLPIEKAIEKWLEKPSEIQLVPKGQLSPGEILGGLELTTMSLGAAFVPFTKTSLTISGMIVGGASSTGLSEAVKYATTGEHLTLEEAVSSFRFGVAISPASQLIGSGIQKLKESILGKVKAYKITEAESYEITRETEAMLGGSRLTKVEVKPTKITKEQAELLRYIMPEELHMAGIQDVTVKGAGEIYKVAGTPAETLYVGKSVENILEAASRGGGVTSETIILQKAIPTGAADITTAATSKFTGIQLLGKIDPQVYLRFIKNVPAEISQSWLTQMGGLPPSQLTNITQPINVMMREVYTLPIAKPSLLAGLFGVSGAALAKELVSKTQVEIGIPKVSTKISKEVFAQVKISPAITPKVGVRMPTVSLLQKQMQSQIQTVQLPQQKLSQQPRRPKIETQLFKAERKRKFLLPGFYGWVGLKAPVKPLNLKMLSNLMFGETRRRKRK